jgi:sugar (pentulose or hexulose) kinase
MSGNDTFCATLAAACGMPVERRAVTEATARGLAGLLGADVAGQGPGTSKAFPPDAAAAAAPGLTARYERWLSAMRLAIN